MVCPDKIDKRLFTCTNCEYSAQEYGETYFDSGCHNYMATFECPECNVLFEGLISQINMNEETFETHHDLAEEVKCLRCGIKDAKVWYMTTGKCPKCGGRMNYQVMGTIKIKY